MPFLPDDLTRVQQLTEFTEDKARCKKHGLTVSMMPADDKGHFFT